MAEEFSNFLDQTREAPIREKVDGLSEIIEKMMILIMSIPESVDKLISNLNDRINAMDSRIASLDGKIANIKVAGPGTPNMVAASPNAATSPDILEPAPCNCNFEEERNVPAQLPNREWS